MFSGMFRSVENKLSFHIKLTFHKRFGRSGVKCLECVLVLKLSVIKDFVIGGEMSRRCLIVKTGMVYKRFFHRERNV